MTDAAPTTADADAAPARPRPVEWAWWATVAWAGLTVISSAVLYFYRPFIRQALIDANAKADAPKANYTGSVVDDDAGSALATGLVASILSAVIVLMVGYFMFKGRVWARWLLLGLATVLPLVLRLGVGVVFQLIAGVLLDAPAVYKTVVIAAGLCALAVAVLLVLPETTRWFAGRRRERPVRRGGVFPRPATAGGSAASTRPPGLLGGLFARRSATRPVTDVPDRGTIDYAAAEVTDSAVATAAPVSTAARRPVARRSATRPGSVKPKGSGSGTGRSKSRRG